MKNSSKYIAALFVFTSSLVLYIFTLCQSTYWWDSGEYITTVYRLGIAHPTGFPFYTLLAKLFIIGGRGNDIAWRINFLSALFSSGVLLYTFFLFMKILEKYRLKIFPVILGTVLLATAYTYWSQSVIAEVYTMNLFFLAAGFYHLYVYYRENGILHFYLTGMLLGLGFSVHTEIIFLIPFFCWIVGFKIFRKQISGKEIIVFITFFTLGITNYLYLPIRSHGNPIIAWQGIDNLKDFLYYISQGEFEQKKFAYSLYGMGILGKIIGKTILLNFHWLGIFLGFLGGIYLLLKNRNIFFGLSGLMVSNIILSMVYGNPGRIEPEFKSFLVPLYWGWTILMGSGLAFALNIFNKVIKWKFIRVIGYVVLCFFLFLYTIFQGQAGLKNIWKIKEDTPVRFAKAILQEIPENSVLIVRTVYTDNLLLYLQEILGYRKDIQVVSLNRHKEITIPDIIKLTERKSVFAEYDLIERLKMGNYFTPNIYFGRLGLEELSPKISEDGWEDILMETKAPEENGEPIIIHAYHPLAVARHNLSVLLAKNGFLEKAFQESQMASLYEPSYSEPYLTRGIWYLQSHQPDQAIKELSSCLDITPLSSNGWMNLGTAYAQKGAIDQSIIYFTIAVKLDPLSQIGWTNLGNAYRLKNDFIRANQSFEKASKI